MKVVGIFGTVHPARLFSLRLPRGPGRLHGMRELSQWKFTVNRVLHGGRQLRRLHQLLLGKKTQTLTGRLWTDRASGLDDIVFQQVFAFLHHITCHFWCAS